MKGQASLEYLTTYGWVFLVVLLTVGGFSYFGIIDPMMLLPERCVFDSGLTCTDFKIEYDGSHSIISFSLQNNLPSDIRLFDEDNPQNRRFTLRIGNTDCTCEFSYFSPTPADDVLIKQGTPKTIQCLIGHNDAPLCADPLSQNNILQYYEGDKVRVHYTYTYQETGKKFPRRGAGQVLARVS